jgi:hypothetical protein
LVLSCLGQAADVWYPLPGARHLAVRELKATPIGKLERVPQHLGRTLTIRPVACERATPAMACRFGNRVRVLIETCTLHEFPCHWPRVIRVPGVPVDGGLRTHRGRPACPATIGSQASNFPALPKRDRAIVLIAVTVAAGVRLGSDDPGHWQCGLLGAREHSLTRRV